MSRHVYNCPDLTIASSGTDSNAIDADPHYQNARGLVIEAPNTLTGTITVEVSFDGGSTFSKLQSSGADISIGAGDAVPITFQGWDSLRVVSGSSEGGARTFKVKAVEDLY